MENSEKSRFWHINSFGEYAEFYLASRSFFICNYSDFDQFDFQMCFPNFLNHKLSSKLMIIDNYLEYFVIFFCENSLEFWISNQTVILTK